MLRVGTIWRRARPLSSIPAIRTCSLACTRGSRRFPNIAPLRPRPASTELHSIMRIAPKMRFPSCSVCNESVGLETSKTDAHGKAAHEECYLGSAPPLECHSFHSCPRAKLFSTRKTIFIFDLGEASHAQRCSSRTRLLRSRSHIRASKTPARDGPFVARGRELRGQKARSSDCHSRTAENDFCQGVMSMGGLHRRDMISSSWVPGSNVQIVVVWLDSCTKTGGHCVPNPFLPQGA